MKTDPVLSPAQETLSRGHEGDLRLRVDVSMGGLTRDLLAFVWIQTEKGSLGEFLKVVGRDGSYIFGKIVEIDFQKKKNRRRWLSYKKATYWERKVKIRFRGTRYR